MTPPKHLSAAMRSWWQSVTKSFALEPHHLLLLERACCAWDRAEQAREILARDGLIVAGREGGSRPHPAVAIARDAEVNFCRVLRELDLDVSEAAPEMSRPPGLRSNRRPNPHARVLMVRPNGAT
jgi:P27 family predicted phage terminase small subunit